MTGPAMTGHRTIGEAPAREADRSNAGFNQADPSAGNYRTAVAPGRATAAAMFGMP